MKKLLIAFTVLGLTVGSANMVTKAAKKTVKYEVKENSKGSMEKKVNKKVKKEKRKMEVKAIKAVL